MKPLVKNKQTIQLIIIFLFLAALTFLLALPRLLSLVVIVLLLYYKTSDQPLGEKNKLIHISLLFTIMLAVSAIILNTAATFAYMIPFAFIPMLTQILFSNQQLSLLITIAGALSISLITNNPKLAVILFTGATIGVVSIKNIRHRSQILKSGLLVGLIQAFGLFFVSKDLLFSEKYLVSYIALSLANGLICASIITVTLPIFEYLFDVATNITLLELSDFNHTLLKRLVIEAPGTYHHSLIVGNLSEAAAETIGANSLLCRVGSYYHDVGKIIKPEYFAENQLHTSKHINIKPSISKTIIMGHVKEGLELAKKHKLKPVIIDFINQHHGTSIVYYFYKRALEEVEEDSLKEDVFRYPGPRPQTKEAGIVLLADSAEAATRALEEPNPAKIQSTVQRIINNKFVDGQLDHCNLTLKDLENISQSFIRILTAIYHSRIPYPAAEE